MSFFRRGLVSVLVAGVTVPLLVASGSSPAVADPIDDARQRLEQTRAEAQEAARLHENTLAERAQAEVDIASIQATIPALQAREAELRANVADRAAALYRRSDPVSQFDLPAGGDVNDPARRAELTQAATRYDENLARELTATVEELGRQEERLRQRSAELDELAVRQEEEKAAFDRAVVEAQRALERAVALGALRAEGDTPIMGAPVLSAAEVASWYESTSGRQRFPGGITALELATIYIEEGLAAGVRGDLAFAQSIVETGSFGATGPNNFAGLGACDSCTTMNQFPTPRDGVRAQVQHLRNYADPTSRHDQLLFPPSPYWYGNNPDTAIRNFNTFFAKGWAPTWEEMGDGNWATDPTYAGKVLGVYQRMLDFNG